MALPGNLYLTQRICFIDMGEWRNHPSGFMRPSMLTGGYRQGTSLKLYLPPKPSTCALGQTKRCTFTQAVKEKQIKQQAWSTAQTSGHMGSYLPHSYPAGSENFPIILSTLDIPQKLIGCPLVCFSVGVLKQTPKLIWGSKGFAPAYRFILKGTQGKNSKREPGISD